MILYCFYNPCENKMEFLEISWFYLVLLLSEQKTTYALLISKTQICKNIFFQFISVETGERWSALLLISGLQELSPFAYFFVSVSIIKYFKLSYIIYYT